MRLRAWGWLPRTTTTAVLAVPLMALGVFVAMSSAKYASPYWLDLSSKATIPMLFVAPGFAALAAWDAARWRPLARAAVRSWPELLVRHLLLVAGATAATFGVTLLLLYRAEPPGAGHPEWDLLAVTVGVCTAYAALGFAVGRFLPPLLGAPLSFGAVWLWVAYTPAVQPFWLRNVTGNLGMSCCSSSKQLAPAALAAPGLIGLVLLGAAFLVLARAAWATAVVGVLAVALAVHAASGMVAGLGADPVVARTGEQTCSTVRGDEFCVWPEDVEVLHQALPVLNRTVTRLRDAGFPLPHRFREDERVTGGFSFGLDADYLDRLPNDFVISALYARGIGSCRGHGSAESHDIRVQDLAQAWLEHVVGTPVEMAARDAFIKGDRLRELLEQPPEAQLAWYHLAIKDLKTCKRLS